jgi:hypothetical protein
MKIADIREIALMLVRPEGNVMRVEFAELGHFPAFLEMKTVSADVAGKRLLSVVPDGLVPFLGGTIGVFVDEDMDHIIKFAVCEVENDVIVL